jgi:hypothetical protein
MNRRERILLISVSSVAVLILLGVVIHYAIALPLKRLDKQIAATRTEIAAVATERRNYFADEERVKGFARQAFSDDIDKASAKSGQILTQLILQSGLAESEFTRLPFGPRKLRQANEIGWSVQGEGPLMQVVNLLFLLEVSPYLHRVEGVTLTPGDAPGRAKVRFRFLTLILIPNPTVDAKDPVPKLTLDSPERRRLDAIVSRDILRPYIKRPPTPPAAPQSPANTAAALAAKPLPGPESLRIVSLSEWEGSPEIHIRDTANERTLRYRPGDPMAGGVVVMVDYRPLPMPGKELLKSFSRVILKIDNEYWAVERGRTLADKYKLKPDQLPAKLPGS